MTIRELDPVQDAGEFVALLFATHPTVVTSAQEWRVEYALKLGR
jgi:hypothetical protein